MSIKSAEVLQQPNLYFGRGWIPGEDNSFSDLPKPERVRVLGMLDACPEPSKMVEVYDYDWIIARYTECNMMGTSGFILQKAKELNPNLASQFQTKIPRIKGENPEGYESDAVPSDYEVNLYPGSSAAGYAASRILIEQFGRSEPWKIGDERVKKGFYLLEEALQEAQTPIEFLVILAAKVVKADAHPTAVLGHLLAVELKGEGIFTQIREIANVLQTRAPELWDYYKNKLTPEERDKSGILPLSIVEPES